MYQWRTQLGPPGYVTGRLETANCVQQFGPLGDSAVVCNGLCHQFVCAYQ